MTTGIEATVSASFRRSASCLSLAHSSLSLRRALLIAAAAYLGCAAGMSWYTPDRVVAAGLVAPAPLGTWVAFAICSLHVQLFVRQLAPTRQASSIPVA